MLILEESHEEPQTNCYKWIPFLVHAALIELYENHEVTYLEMSPHIHKVDHT